MREIRGEIRLKEAWYSWCRDMGETMLRPPSLTGRKNSFRSSLLGGARPVREGINLVLIGPQEVPVTDVGGRPAQKVP